MRDICPTVQIILSWNPRCQEKLLSNLCACFVTADLYERTTTDNEPGLGETDDMISFAGCVASYGGRGVACNTPTYTRYETALNFEKTNVKSLLFCFV
jgi:hypothetical protein